MYAYLCWNLVATERDAMWQVPQDVTTGIHSEGQQLKAGVLQSVSACMHMCDMYTAHVHACDGLMLDNTLEIL